MENNNMENNQPTHNYEVLKQINPGDIKTTSYHDDYFDVIDSLNIYDFCSCRNYNQSKIDKFVFPYVSCNKKVYTAALNIPIEKHNFASIYDSTTETTVQHIRRKHKEYVIKEVIKKSMSIGKIRWNMLVNNTPNDVVIPLHTIDVDRLNMLGLDAYVMSMIQLLRARGISPNIVILNPFLVDLIVPTISYIPHVYLPQKIETNIKYCSVDGDMINVSVYVDPTLTENDFLCMECTFEDHLFDLGINGLSIGYFDEVTHYNIKKSKDMDDKIDDYSDSFYLEQMSNPTFVEWESKFIVVSSLEHIEHQPIHDSLQYLYIDNLQYSDI